MHRGLIGLVVTLVACAGPAPAPQPAAAPTSGAAGAASASNPPAAGATTPAATARPLTRLPVATIGAGSTGDAGFALAAGLGYFAEEGLEMENSRLANASLLVPAMQRGDVPVAGMGLNAALFTALHHGALQARIVADKGSNHQGGGGALLLVRTELLDSGRVRDYPDLRGLKIGLPGLTTALGAEFAHLHTLGGLAEGDVEGVPLGFADMLVALSNGALDGALMTEPFVARAGQSGIAVRWKGADDIYPNRQLTTLLYSADFARQQPEAAIRFLKAYVRGARDYATVIKGGGDRTPIYRVLAEYTPIKDLSIYPATVPSGIHPDGALNVQSLETDQEMWMAQGAVPQRADLAVAIDLQPLDAALRRLGSR